MKITNAVILLLAATLTHARAQSPPTPAVVPPTPSIEGNPAGPEPGAASLTTTLKAREVRVFPLKYARAVELKDKIRPALSGRGSVEADERTNTLIANDQPENIASLSALLRDLDIPVAAGASQGGFMAPQNKFGGAAAQPGNKADESSIWRPSYSLTGARASTAADNVGPLITFSQMDPKALEETAEDLNIFGLLLKRNLDRSLGEEAPNQKMGIQMLLKPGGRLDQAFYVEGFGACFNLRVHFPLLAPATPEPKKESPPADSEWQKARSALYGGPAAAAADPFQTSEAVAFDEHLVEMLKARVVETLKNATNFRHLNPEEWIVVNITGSPNVAGRPGHSVSPGANFSPDVPLTGAYSAVNTAVPPTVMTLRIQKKIADHVAPGTFEQFQQAVEVHTHLGIAGGRRTASAGANSFEDWAKAVEDFDAAMSPYLQKQ